MTSSERQALFIQKLQLCSIRMPFNKEPPDDMRNKEIKRLNLLEIMDYINNTKNVFNEQTFYEITSMVRAAAAAYAPPAPRPAGLAPASARGVAA